MEGNIKCGNSLVGTDIYDSILEFEHKNENDLNPFDWNLEFKTITEKGGFDCIVGNPPYYNISILDKTYYKYLEHHYQAIHTGKNDVFTVTNKYAEENNFEKKLIRKNLKNSDIARYSITDRGDVLIYTDNNTDIKKYPNIYEYLKKHKKILSERNEASKGLYEWYRFERPRKKQTFDAKEKIVVPYRAEYNKFAYDDSQYFNNGGDIRFIVITDDTVNTKYVLAILNSKLMNWIY